MKLFAPLAAALALLVVTTGCQSSITNLREQLKPTYHDVVVEADENAAYAAALSALARMGYAITSSGAAQKKIEALGAVSTGDASRPARQLTASARIGVAPNNTTAIQILFTEIREEMNSRREGMGTKQPLAVSPLYNVFARYVDEALAQKQHNY